MPVKMLPYILKVYWSELIVLINTSSDEIGVDVMKVIFSPRKWHQSKKSMTTAWMISNFKITKLQIVVDITRPCQISSECFHPSINPCPYLCFSSCRKIIDSPLLTWKLSCPLGAYHRKKPEAEKLNEISKNYQRWRKEVKITQSPHPSRRCHISVKTLTTSLRVDELP